MIEILSPAAPRSPSELAPGRGEAPANRSQRGPAFSHIMKQRSSDQVGPARRMLCHE